jgi:flagellar hook assembly protein FlgD
VPGTFSLLPNYPNPFNPSTTISFSLPARGKVTLTVYDITGRKVRELISGQVNAGMHSVVWEGKDERGKGVSSGVYLSRLESDDKVITRKMLLMR